MKYTTNYEQSLREFFKTISNSDLLEQLKNKKEWYDHRNLLKINIQGDEVTHHSVYQYFLLLDEATNRKINHHYHPNFIYKNGVIYDLNNKEIQRF